MSGLTLALASMLIGPEVARFAAVPTRLRLRRGPFVATGYGILVDGWWCGTFTAGEPINQATSAFGVTPEAAVSAWWKQGTTCTR